MWGMENETPSFCDIVKRNHIPDYIGNIHKRDMHVLSYGSFTIGEDLTRIPSRKGQLNNS